MLVYVWDGCIVLKLPAFVGASPETACGLFVTGDMLLKHAIDVSCDECQDWVTRLVEAATITMERFDPPQIINVIRTPAPAPPTPLEPEPEPEPEPCNRYVIPWDEQQGSLSLPEDDHVKCSTCKVPYKAHLRTEPEPDDASVRFSLLELD